MIMKTIASTLLALSVLAGAATSAHAFDTKGFFQQEERWSRWAVSSRTLTAASAPDFDEER